VCLSASVPLPSPLETTCRSRSNQRSRVGLVRECRAVIAACYVRAGLFGAECDVPGCGSVRGTGLRFGKMYFGVMTMDAKLERIQKSLGHQSYADIEMRDAECSSEPTSRLCFHVFVKKAAHRAARRLSAARAARVLARRSQTHPRRALLLFSARSSPQRSREALYHQHAAPPRAAAVPLRRGGLGSKAHRYLMGGRAPRPLLGVHRRPAPRRLCFGHTRRRVCEVPPSNV